MKVELLVDMLQMRMVMMLMFQEALNVAQA